MITRVRGRGDIELRSFALTDMVRFGYSGLRGTTMSVSEKEVRGIPALNRAARIKAEALAGLRLRCWRGEGQDRRRVDNVWQARLFRDEANDYQTRFTFWETIGESLAWRNNAYVWKMTDPVTERVIELWALHPDQVTCKDDGTYRVRMAQGYLDPVGNGPAEYLVDQTVIMHIQGHGGGGTYEAPSPIQVFREALAGPIGRQRYENRLWRRGSALQVVVELQPGTTVEQARAWKETWQSTYEGTDGDSTAVVSGANVKPIGMTLSDSKFVEMANLTARDAAWIMGVPAGLLGVQIAEHPTTLEQDLREWLQFGLGPDLARIEAALQADEQLFGKEPPNAASVYPKFDTEMFVRGDLMTEAEILVSLVQAGILLPDEARKIRGLDDLPNGVGKIPQITPVGGAPNLQPKPPKPPKAPALNGSS